MKIMIQLHKHDERGHNKHGWQDTHYSFSLGGYYNPEHTHLWVTNDAHIISGAEFPIMCLYAKREMNW